MCKEDTELVSQTITSYADSTSHWGKVVGNNSTVFNCLAKRGATVNMLRLLEWYVE